MANHHFQGGSSWWTAAARTSTTSAAAASVSSSADQLSVSSFNWPSAAAADVLEAKSRSSDESPVSISNSSITFQEIQNSHAPSAMITAPLLDTATPQALDFGLSSPTIDSFFGGRGDQSSFHSLLQEDVMESNQIHLGIDHSSSLHRSSLFLQDGGHVLSSNNIPILLSSPSNSAVLQGLVEPSDQSSRQMSLHRSLFYDAQPMLKSMMRSSSPNINLYDHRSEALDESPPSSTLQSNYPQFIKALPDNRSPSSSIAESQYPNFHHGRPSQVLLPVLQNDNSCYSSNNLIPKASSNLTSTEKRIGSAPAVKKPRLGAAPSSSPAFKVRKEKLGDRITALQQLVSPFGKTDTASVLHEAIEYIKFLHDQVRVSSAPYLKNGHQLQQVKSNRDQKTSKELEGHDEDLRSRGLCLVPISSTFAVANEIPTDFWTPTFVGSFR